MKIHESSLDKKSTWYFGNNRAKNLKLSPPKWYSPFFLTTSFKYAKDYADYGVYTIKLEAETGSNILDFNKTSDVKRLNWPKVLVDKIRAGHNDLNSLAYDMYILAFNTGGNLIYISNTKQWRDAAYYFKEKSKNIFKTFTMSSVWGTEDDHAFVLQMWKDIYDAGFDGFMQNEFGNKVLALFNIHCIDKISINPVNTKLNESKDSKKDMGEVSDGFHTFNELYFYRMLYNAAFFNELAKNTNVKVLKSKLHHDGKPPFDSNDMFIVQAELPTGQVSNHYNMKDWDMFSVEEADFADEWDGHTPQQAAERLEKFILNYQCRDED